MIRIYNSFARRLSLYICGVVAVFFFIAAAISIQQSVKQTAMEADRNAFAQLDIISHRIEKILVSVESAVNNIAVDVQNELMKPQPDEQRLFEITRQLVRDNEFITGSIVSLSPYILGEDQRYFAAYSARDRLTDSIATGQVGNADYDYTAMDWYQVPRLLDLTYWTDPYFDEGAGNIIMCTYSKPLKNAEGKFLGVFTADIPIHWLSDKVNSFKPYRSSYNLMIGKDASYIAHTDSARILRETIFTHTYNVKDTMVHHIGMEMVNGKRGSAVFEENNVRSTIFYTPIPITGWAVAMVCPNRDIYEGTHSLGNKLILTLVLALLLLFVVVYFVIRRMTQPLHAFSKSAHRIAEGDFHTPLPQISSKDEMMMLRDSFHFMQTSLTSYIDRLKETTSAKERIESELNIAREIQMSMIPKVFPPYPERNDIDIFALMQPAKEVGGDLYDFFIDGNKIYFAVGDVSGKGVPASLFMAVTRSIFRSVATSMGTPSAIIQAMNHAMCEGNDANMFVTLFIGIMDFSTGQMTYCNAGHNPPVLMSETGEVGFVDVAACTGLPVGVFDGMPYSDQTMDIRFGSKLILYTDGLTEAENKQAQLYGDDRLMATLRRKGFASMHVKDLLENLYADVEAHVAGAEQSDDLTLMVMEFKGEHQKKENDGAAAAVHRSANYQRIELTNEIAQIHPMTAWLEGICERFGVSPSLCMSITLALEEAVSNVIMYAYPAGTAATFFMDFDTEDGEQATWRIVDTGVPFDPTAQADADITLDVMERPIGGLGIFLVKQIMDEVTYNRADGQNILTMRINLRKQ